MMSFKSKTIEELRRNVKKCFLLQFAQYTFFVNALKSWSTSLTLLVAQYYLLISQTQLTQLIYKNVDILKHTCMERPTERAWRTVLGDVIT